MIASSGICCSNVHDSFMAPIPHCSTAHEWNTNDNSKPAGNGIRAAREAHVPLASDANARPSPSSFVFSHIFCALDFPVLGNEGSCQFMKDTDSPDEWGNGLSVPTPGSNGNRLFKPRKSDPNGAFLVACAPSKTIGLLNRLDKKSNLCLDWSLLTSIRFRD